MFQDPPTSDFFIVKLVVILITKMLKELIFRTIVYVSVNVVLCSLIMYFNEVKLHKFMLQKKC